MEKLSGKKEVLVELRRPYTNHLLPTFSEMSTRLNNRLQGIIESHAFRRDHTARPEKIEAAAQYA